MWTWAALVAGSTVVISLYTGPVMWWGIGSAAAVTVALTFLLPSLHRPGVPEPKTSEPVGPAP
jgi:UDP-GlcNAc:undecaprenyl-phosphate GlcNAc-1-phosphate transferase